MTRIAAVLCLVLWAIGAAWGADPIKEKLDKAKAAYDAELKKARDGLLASFTKKEDAARKAGDKKLVDQVIAERDRFEADSTLPKVISTTEYTRQVRQALRTAEAAYKQAVKEYLVAKMDDAAEAVTRDLDQLLRQNASLTPKDTGPLQTWVGAVDGQAPMKLEILTQEGTEFTANYYILFKDGSVRHHARIKGKIESGTISFRWTPDNVVKDGGQTPAVLTGKMTSKRIEGIWETLRGGARGVFYLDLQKKKQ